MISTKEYKFQPGAMSIIQMGEELIGHPSTALNELVKNAYDADADKCWIYTHFDSAVENTFLIIKDNGLGMNAETLFGGWLRPSISSKRDEDKSKRKSIIYERRYLGMKGIGRLASMALGRYLTVITKKKEDLEYNWLKIDREKFRVETLLEKIEFPGGAASDFNSLFNNDELTDQFKLPVNDTIKEFLHQSPFDDFLEGTMIILQHLDDSIKTIIENEFQTKEIEDTAIFKSLVDLITPLQLNNSIQNELIANGIIDEHLRVSNGESTFELFYGINLLKNEEQNNIEFIPIEPSSIIEYFDYRIFGKVDILGNVLGKYLCKRLDEDIRDEEFTLNASFILSDDDLRIRKIKELEENREASNKEKETGLGEFYFDIRVYDLDTDAKEKIALRLRAKGKNEATRILKKYLGLKISKNGFGVKPYGEEEQDWLGLGAKRVQQHKVTIGPNQILGYLFLYSPENDALNEKTNREGFFENKAFITFKKIINGILEGAGRRRAKYREIHNIGRAIKSRNARPDTEKFIKYLLSNSDNAELHQVSKQFIEETNSALDSMEYSLTFSQRLASLGTGLELVYHEISQPIAALGSTVKSLETNLLKIQEKELQERLLARVANIGAATKTLNSLKESLKPAIGRSLPKSFSPLSTFNRVCFLFESTFKDADIDVTISANVEDVKISSFEYVFWISILNIINNAVYWLNFAENKKIIIFEYESPDTFIISNTGPKIPEEDIEIIFEYGITGKNERNATGLGLAFTRSMLTAKGWNIWAENRIYGPAFYIKRSTEN
ncbi:ATP-binding protein [Pontibacter sp. E15-1]|uniref:sensor histidine kinase n=1 Tax=Pontibacter sp. E15-1 TaxID=2919918 RepID=UPI001F4FA364|nr:sensor histidine kinase [Pontibacter sp. E15-1]MCJ8165003.1 ATP-binding protein [Pontibacter sp. E15-1]